MTIINTVWEYEDAAHFTSASATNKAARERGLPSGSYEPQYKSKLHVWVVAVYDAEQTFVGYVK